MVSSTNNLSIFAGTTSAQLAGVLSDETGTGLAVFSIAPVFTSINNNLSIFAATTSAQLAGVLSDETGTGVVVFGTSPTFTTGVGIGVAPAAGVVLDISAAQSTARIASSTATDPTFTQYLANASMSNVIIGSEGTTAGNLAAGVLANAGLLTQQGAFALQFGTNSVIRWTFDTIGNAGLGTGTPPTGGGPALAIAQGAQPTGIAANTAGIWVQDVAGTAELMGFDEAGNDVQLTAHPTDFLNTLPLDGRPYPYAFFAKNPYLGKAIYVDMAGLIIAIEGITAQKFAYIKDIPRENWDENQVKQIVRRKLEIELQTQELNRLSESISIEEDIDKKNVLLARQSRIVIPPPYSESSFIPSPLCTSMTSFKALQTMSRVRFSTSLFISCISRSLIVRGIS